MRFFKINRLLVVVTLQILVIGCDYTEINKIEIEDEDSSAKIPLIDTTKISIPNKRSISLHSDLNRIGLKGDVKLVKYRYYDSFINDFGDREIDKGHLRDFDIISGLNPILEASVEANCDLYFDYDGFEIKRIDYDLNEKIKKISLSYRDANGNLYAMKFIPELENDKEVYKYFLGPYNPDSFRPTEKRNTVDIGTEKVHFNYDQNKEIILTWSSSRINPEPPKIVTKYVYNYDEKGNWTIRYVAVKLKDSNTFELIGAVEREIIYFD
jgi:hypothetical protein